MNALFIVPFENGSPQFPGLAEGEQVGFCTFPYTPPPEGTPPYALVELTTTQANIDVLTARPDCLFLANVTADGWDTAAIAPTERVAVRTKIVAMGFEGATYGLLVAAINASQNRTDLVYAIGTNAFFRNNNKDFMREVDMIGAGLGVR